MNKTFQKWFSEKKDLYLAALQEYIEIDTSSPNEKKAWSFLFKQFTTRGFSIEKQPINKKIWSHPYHCSKSLSKISKKSYNIIARNYIGENNTVLINCHIDVVPNSNKFKFGFNPKIIRNKLFGRGACDTKNNLIMLFGALDYLSSLGLSPKKNLIIHLPIEEEIGGNGTLSMAFEHKEKVDCAIVFEPTNFEIYRGHRGCITFNITLFGKPTHMGEGQNGVSAIDLAIKIIDSLKNLEKKLLQDAKKNPDFKKWEKPLQLNIGTIKGGEWHGSIPEKACITGNFGFLPDTSIDSMMQILRSVVEQVAKEYGGKVKIDFKGLKNDAYIMPQEEQIISDMHKSCKKNGVEQNGFYGWNVSCDARIYYKELGIPTIVFGCGRLKNAHSNHENIVIAELKKGIKIMSDFLLIESVPSID